MSVIWCGKAQQMFLHIRSAALLATHPPIRVRNSLLPCGEAQGHCFWSVYLEDG